MKIILTLFLLSIKVCAFNQTPTELAQPIVKEGKLLYRSEMASWYGTDIFLEKYSNRNNIKGYFSYQDNDTAKCIFYSKGDHPRVIGMMGFDSTYSTNTASIDLQEREFTPYEKELFQLRTNALNEIQSDTILFKTYKNTDLNLIPLISNNERKVYVLTGPKNNGVVIIGNDYLLTYDNSNQLLTKKRLHQNIIPIYYGEQQDDKQIVGTMHSHLPETGDFITATDICTLMLYEKLAKWKSHQVVSKNYLNIWNCETNSLIVVPRDVMDRIEKDQEKKNKKKEK